MSDIENAIITQAGPFDSLLDDAEDLLGGQTLDFVDDEPVDDGTAARLTKLEAAARELAAAEMTREARKLRRKVAAATTGAGASGFIPLALQLLGVYDLDPAIAASLSTVASLIGAFAAGWATPERTPPLPADSAHSLLQLGD
jgi:hypothetical protein